MKRSILIYVITVVFVFMSCSDDDMSNDEMVDEAASDEEPLDEEENDEDGMSTGLLAFQELYDQGVDRYLGSFTPTSTEEGRGCDCLKTETQLVVKAVWSGGVRAKNGNELGLNELNHFEVTLVQEADTLIVTPFQLADLDDNNNNIDLCLKESGTPLLLKVNKSVAIDPRGDKNPKTQIEIKSRW